MNESMKFSGYHSVFATRLREVMETPPITTHAELAKQIGMTKQAISKYANGSVLPNAEKLCKICNYFNIPSDYFLGITDSKSKDMGIQYIQDRIGLSVKSIENLENIYYERFLFTLHHPIHKTGPIDFMLSNQKYLAYYQKNIVSYINAENDDSEQLDAEFILFKLSRAFESAVKDFKVFCQQASDKENAKKKPNRKGKVINGINAVNKKE